MHGMIQGGPSMSINPNTLTSNQLPAVPPHQSQQQQQHQPQSSHASQTLPLKSNLKKSNSSAAAAGSGQSSSGSQHQLTDPRAPPGQSLGKTTTLQWSASTAEPRPSSSSANQRVSLEELRV